MSQLQSVLRRSVAHLDPSDHDGRERVFVNAREAMIRLLWSYDPPLSPSEIDSKIDEFDDIVAIILGERTDETEAEAEAAETEPDEAERNETEPAWDEDEGGSPDDAEVPVAAPAPLTTPSRPPADAPVMSERRAEALALLRRPARFEPMPQIGSPTPGALAGKSDTSAALAAKPPTEGALLAKLAVDQALARLNGKLAPIPEETAEPDDDRDALDEPLEDEADEAVATDDAPEDDAENDADLFEDDDAADAVEADDRADDEEEDDREADSDDATDEELDEDDGRDDDDTDDERDTDDDTDEDELPADPRARAMPRHLVEDDDDVAGDRDDDDDAAADEDDDLRDRPTLRERLSEIAGGLNGTMIAAAAAGVVGLAGILLGTTYFMSRPDTPQLTAAAPEQPAPPAASAGEPAPPTATPTEPATPPAEAPPPAAIPNGGLALETLSLFDGRDPSVFQSSPGNPIRFEGDTLGGFARISSSPNGSGSRITVGRGVFERLEGRTVRVVVVARAAATDPASSLRFSYQNGRSLSPWFDGALGTDYAPLSLTWQVPKERGGPETDAIMIEPGIPGDGTAADVSSVRIEILQ